MGSYPRFHLRSNSSRIALKHPLQRQNWISRALPRVTIKYLIDNARSQFGRSQMQCFRVPLACRGWVLDAVLDPTPQQSVSMPVNSQHHVIQDLGRARVDSYQLASTTWTTHKRELAAKVDSFCSTIPGTFMIVGLVCTQVITLTGSLVGGHLARMRRIELERVNTKLRNVVREMRKQQEEQHENLDCAADPNEAALAYKKALENSLKAPSAPHPIEAYGSEGNSLAGERRKISELLSGAKEDLAQMKPLEAELKCTDALVRCRELADKRALRASLRLLAKAQVELGQYKKAIACLEEALQVSQQLQNHVGDVDTLGAMADIHVTLGDLEKASELYDRVLSAVRQEGENAVDSLGSWDG